MPACLHCAPICMDAPTRRKSITHLQIYFD